MRNGCVKTLTWTQISVYWQWRMAVPKLYKKEERLTLREHSSSFGGVLVAHLFSFYCCVLLYVFTFWVPSCDVHYDFRIKQCSVHIYLQVFIGGPMSYLRYLCFLRYWYPIHILLCVCFVCLRLVYHMLSFSLDCPFLIAPSVFLFF